MFHHFRGHPATGLARIAALVLALSGAVAPSLGYALADCPGIVEIEGVDRIGVEGSQSCDASACPAGVGTLAGVVAGICGAGVFPQVECGFCECCRDDSADLYTGTEATLLPGGAPETFCGVGGRGREIAEAAVCLLRDLASPAGPPSLGGAGIHLSADVPIPVGTVTAQQQIGLLEFVHDAGATSARVHHTTGYCLPGLGCIEGQTQTFTASLVQDDTGAEVCGDWTLADPYKLAITADEQQFNLGVAIGPILIPVPVGAISVTPRLDFESNQQAVTSPWNAGNQSSGEDLCFETHYRDAMEAAQVPLYASLAGENLGSIDGWQSVVGFGGRDPRVDGALWDPGSGLYPERPDLDFSVARSAEEKKPGARFHGGLRLAYSLADILAALGIPASFPPFFLDDISVYVQSDVDAAVASQLQLFVRESDPDSGPDCTLHPGVDLHLQSRLATAASLLVKAGFRMVFTIDLGIFEKTFRIEEEVPAVSLTPDPIVVSSPAATAGIGTRDAPVPGMEVPGLSTFSSPSPADDAAFLQACLTDPPPPVASPPTASLVPGDPSDLGAAVQVPCNICVYLPETIISACVPKSGVAADYDCGLGVNGYGCSDPNCENRPVDPPVSANVQRVVNGASQASLPFDRQWSCDAVSKNGCMDLCIFDPSAEQPLAVVQSAVDLKGAVCRFGDGTFDPPKACAQDSECDDGNPGTSDDCAAWGVCVHDDLDGIPCDDGIWCNGADVTVGGQCIGHAGNPCFAAGDCCLEESDSCVDHCPTSPCDGRNPGDACDDGSACTVGDACEATAFGLACRGDAAVTCTTSDPCMAAACEEQGGAPVCVEIDNGSCPRCGNGFVDGADECDDGNATSGDGCDANCTPTACGNGVVTAGEECDDADATDGDGCDSNCTVTACGNGVVTGSEECDDGDDESGDGCDVNCTASGCGNGVAAGAEPCDDANAVDGDGCDTDCTVTVCTPTITTNCAVPHDHIAFAKEVTGTHVVETVPQAEYLTRTEAEEPLFPCVEYGGPDRVTRTVWYRYTPPVDGDLEIRASGSRTLTGVAEQRDHVVGVYRTLTYQGGAVDLCATFPQDGGFVWSTRVEDDSTYMIVMGAPPWVDPVSSEDYRLELTLLPDPLVPATGIQVQRAGDDVMLTWDDLSSEETGYRVWRRDGVDDFSPVNVASLPANTEDFLDTGEGADCGFRVYDVSVVGDGVPGDYDGGQFLLRPCAPGHDTVATATAVGPAGIAESVEHSAGATVDADDVPLSCAFLADLPARHSVWYTVSPAVDSTMDVALAGSMGVAGWSTAVQVFDGDPDEATRVACASGPTELVFPSLDDVPLLAGHTYRVQVAYAGFSDAVLDFEYSVSISIAGSAPPPTAPAAVVASRGIGFAQDRVRVEWTDTNADETGHEVESSTDAGATWTPAGSVGADVDAFEVDPASCEATMWRVRARRGAEASDWAEPPTALAGCGAPAFAPAAAACQIALGKAVAPWMSARLAALQSCRSRFHAGEPQFMDDAGTVPLTDVAACAAETKTAKAIAKAATRARATAGKKCSDASVAELGACAGTLDALLSADGGAGCLVDAVGAAVDAMVDDEHGRVLTPPETAEADCQDAIAKAGLGLAKASMKALASCAGDLAKGKARFTDEAKTQPVTTLAGCSFDHVVLGKIAKAAAAARKAVARPGKEACIDATVASLTSACAVTVDGLVDTAGSGCLRSGHAAAAAEILAASH